MFNRRYFGYKWYNFAQQSEASTIELKWAILTNPYTNEELEPFLCYNAKAGAGRSFRDTPEIREFVKRVKREYEEAFGPMAATPVFRCDIFVCQDGRLVINEIEHFEACIDPIDTSKDCEVKEFLTRFWMHQIASMIGINL